MGCSRTSVECNPVSDNQLFLQNGALRQTSVVAKYSWELLGCEMFSSPCSPYCKKRELNVLQHMRVKTKKHFSVDTINKVNGTPSERYLSQVLRHHMDHYYLMDPELTVYIKSGNYIKCILYLTDSYVNLKSL